MFAPRYFAGRYFPPAYFTPGGEPPAVADVADPFWAQVEADAAALCSSAGGLFGLARQVILASGEVYGLWQPSRVAGGEWRAPFVLLPVAAAAGIVAGATVRVDGATYRAAGVPMPTGFGFSRVVLDLGPVS